MEANFYNDKDKAREVIYKIINNQHVQRCELLFNKSAIYELLKEPEYIEYFHKIDTQIEIHEESL